MIKKINKKHIFFISYIFITSFYSAIYTQDNNKETQSIPISNVIINADSSSTQPLIVAPEALSNSITADEDATIYLNFENASLASIVYYLGEQKKINIIPHKDLDNTKVSLTTRNPLTIDRAWNILLTLLEINGFTMVKVGKLYRIISSADNGLEALPVVYSSSKDISLDDLSDNDEVIRYAYFCKNIKIKTVTDIISRMFDEKNIVANEDLNMCLIKGKSINIKAALKIIKELDDNGLRESIEFVPLKWANADTVKNLFNDILGSTQDDKVIRFNTSNQKESSFFSNTTKIIPEPLKNYLILLGKQKNLEKIKNFVFKYIDVPINNAASRLHVKELHYVRAQDIQPIIEEIIKPPKGSASDKSLVMEGGYKIFEDIIMSAELDDNTDQQSRGNGNRLIIACNQEDWKRLSAFIDQIDKPQPQVAIEVMIVDVTLGQTRALGAQLFNIRGKPLASGVNIECNNLAASQIAPSATSLNSPFINLATQNNILNPNSSYITMGSAIAAKQNIWGFIAAAMSLTNSQIVFQPYIIVNNNQKGMVSSKTIFRVPGKIDTKNIQAVQETIDLPAEIKVEITPKANLAGVIDLIIDLSIEEFQEDQPTDTPTKTSRALNTKASMAAGEVLILGGLTGSSVKETISKTPILSSIPILGALFKSRQKIKSENNLYVFIRPSIIKPRFEGSPDEYTQLKLDYAKYQIMKHDGYIKDKDPIQRWFFKPTNQTITQRTQDATNGILRPIDNFASGHNRPAMVNMQNDPYFKTSESLEKNRFLRKTASQTAV